MSIITARIRRMTEGNVFTLSTISGWGGPHPADWGGGVPLPRSGQGGTPSSCWGVPHSQVWTGVPPSQVWMGVPIQLTGGGGTPFPGLDGWVPHLGRGTPTRVPPQQGLTPTRGNPTPPGVPPPYRSSIACTCFAAGGVPLAFTQEDLLVFAIILGGHPRFTTMQYLQAN